MKLLFDATELSYFNEPSGHRAGVFNVSLNLFYELQKKGLDITFCCDYRRLEFLKRTKDFQNVPLLNENNLINKLWSKLIFYTDKLPLKIKYAILILSRFYDRYLYCENEENILQLKDFDIYFSPYTPPCKEIQGSKIKKFRMLHDTIPIIENGYPKSPKDWYYKIYTTINDNDYYFANSECTKKDILKYFPSINPDNIKITYLGAKIMTDEFTDIRQKYNLPEKYILSLCTLGKRKNLEFTINNFFNFINKNNITDLYLVLAGGIWEKYKTILKKYLHNKDSSKVILTGYIYDTDLCSLYSNAIMFIFPSLYEGFGLPVLEAMQCGCPVITSDTSSLSEVIGDSGIQINPNSDEELIAAYEKMYFNPSFREECRKKSLERAKLFSWEKCASEILEFIQSRL